MIGAQTDKAAGFGPPYADPEPTLDRLEQDEDDQPDAVGVIPRSTGKGSLPD